MTLMIHLHEDLFRRLKGENGDNVRLEMKRTRAHADLKKKVLKSTAEAQGVGCIRNTSN